MKTNHIDEAITLAEKFIESAKNALNEQNNAPLHKHWKTNELESIYYSDILCGDLHGGYLSADVKRKSMDLTRCLAKMRNGYNGSKPINIV